MNGSLRHVVVIAGLMSAAWIAAGVHFSRCEPMYEARARVNVRRSGTAQPAVSTGEVEGSTVGGGTVEGEDMHLPSIMTQASDLLKKWGVIVALDSVLDSEVDVLAQRTTLVKERQAGQDEITLCYRTIHQQQAVAVLKAISEAYVSARNNGSLPTSSPLLATLEAQRKQVAENQKTQQALIGDLQRKLAAHPFPETQRTAVLEKVKQLSAAIGEARRRCLESEQRLLQARRDIEAGLPVQLLAARLPEGQAKALLLASFESSKTRSDVDQLSAKLQAMAAIYGRKHPRMQELRRTIDELTNRLQDAATESDSEPESGAQVSENLFLKVLASELSEHTGYEERLCDLIEVERIELDRHSALQGALAAGNQELVRLAAESENLRQRWEALNSQERPPNATLIEPPALAALPVWPRFEWHATAGTGAGGALCLLYLLVVAVWPKSRSIPTPMAERSSEPATEMGVESPRTLLERRMERAARLQALRAHTA